MQPDVTTQVREVEITVTHMDGTVDRVRWISDVYVTEVRCHATPGFPKHETGDWTLTVNRHPGMSTHMPAGWSDG